MVSAVMQMRKVRSDIGKKRTNRPILIDDGVCYVLLSNGEETICDEADYEIVAAYSWYMTPKGYAAAHACLPGRRRQVVKLHQLLNPSWKMTDHKNGNRLDNRRCNLRECTARQNSLNRKSWGATSRFKGVCWDMYHMNWVVRVGTEEKRVLIGRYDNEIEAAKAYDEAARRLHGEFARINFPGDAV